MLHTERRRRSVTVITIALMFFAAAMYAEVRTSTSVIVPVVPGASNIQLARDALKILAVKERAPHTGYSREHFGSGWEELGGCDMRNHILKRDLADVVVRSATDCTVLRGTLREDPYTGKTIQFARGATTSKMIQIDHIVAVSDAWQKGAQRFTMAQRQTLYNDPLNLLAVDGATNTKKGDGDAATWLPPNKPYRCRYIARQIAVKIRYKLWVTAPEQQAMQRVLRTCPSQVLPIVTSK